MSTRSQRLKLPAVFTAGSFLCLLLIVFLTNPVDDLAYVMLFFFIFLVFLASLGYGLVLMSSESVSKKTRSKILIISSLLALLAMFKSAGALGWADALVLILICSGLIFYSSRRA